LRNAELRDPDLAIVRIVSGRVNLYNGIYRKAELDFRRAVDLEPSNGSAYRFLAKTLEETNESDQALAAYQKAAEVEPSYYQHFQDLCWFYYEREHYEDAIQWCKKMVDLAPGLSDPHITLAAPYLNLMRFEEAETQLRIALGLQETSRAYHGLGIALL